MSTAITTSAAPRATSPAHRFGAFCSWCGQAAGGMAVLALILAVSFWDTVIRGRSASEQMEDAR